MRGETCCGPDGVPYWCIGKCEIRWHHVSPDDTDMVCLSCSLRARVPPGQRPEASGSTWGAFLAGTQAVFEAKALVANAAARPQACPHR